MHRHLFIFIILSAVLLAGCCDDKAVPAAIRALYSTSAHDRNDAAQTLARCGDKASRAVPRLSELLYDENVGVQSSAAYALRKIGTKEANAALERATAKRRK